MSDLEKNFPYELLEWAVWANLNRQKNVELVLLKGHLYLEAALSTVILDKNLSFYGKVNRFNNRYKNKKVSSLLLELNSIRNELAHNYNFSEEESGLSEWASKVLTRFEPIYFTRRTYRTKIVHAFSVLSKEIIYTKRTHAT